VTTSEEGERYTRRDIHDLVGGEIQTYLPARDGVVTCACLTLSRNPDAPNTILVGQSPRVLERARQLCRQGSTIPVFLKRATSSWEYVGDYGVERCSRESGDLEKYGRLSGRDDLAIVVFLKKR
jgi:hypothetical protein